MSNNSYNLVFTFILLLVAPDLWAEYRAYQYLLGSKNVEQKNTTIITSSFNPVAMTSYYGINKNQLYLLRTWVCPGNTSLKKICIPPYQKENLESFVMNQNKEDK